MYRRALVLGYTLVVGLLAATFPSAATTITATSYNTWNTSTYITGSTTLVDLTSLQAGLNYSTAAGYTSSSNYNFTGPDGGGYSLKTQTFGSATGLIGASDGVGYIKVSLPGVGNSAFLLDALCESSCGTMSLTLSDGENFTVNNGQFGVSISHDVTWFDLGASSGTQPFLEYLYFGTSSLPPDSPASEAATPVLVGGGLMVLLGAGRRKLLRRP